MWHQTLFLNLIENAECVCSNSFHGIAFSIIFEKEFYRVGAMNQTGEIKKDDRIDNILNWCGSSNGIMEKLTVTEKLIIYRWNIH